MPEPTYLIYEIQNIINNKIYRGAHYGTPDDGYMGSGKLIEQAIKKYGKANFTKTVLCECNNRKDMYTKEYELITPEFVAREDTYNLVPGGCGSKDRVSCPQARRDKISAALTGVPHTQERNKAQSDRQKGVPQSQKHNDACRASYTQERKDKQKSWWTQERKDERRNKSLSYWTQERRDAQGIKASAEWSQERRDAQSAKLKAIPLRVPAEMSPLAPYHREFP